jgi:hypothetical protein
MKRILGIALGAALALAALAPVSTSAIGPGPAMFPPKSPLRYVTHPITFSTTANLTAQVVGMCPIGGGIVKDVILVQAAAGVGGTSWTATPKKNGTAIDTTDGVIALTDGANKSVNTGNAPIALAKPTGATRPALKTDGTASCVGGDVFTIDITLSGTYSTAVTGAVYLLIEPKI